jgi:hypothetical protein
VWQARAVHRTGHADDNGSALPPVQAGLRFLVELAALVCWGVVGWNLGSGPMRWVLAGLLPILAAIIWISFRVPGDQSAGGDAPVSVPGIVRLFIEFDVLLGGAIFAILTGAQVLGSIVFIAVCVHYLLTIPRVRWLLAQRPTAEDLGL